MLLLWLLVLSIPAVAADKLKIEKPDRVGRVIENQYFIADLSHRTIRGVEEDSGTLRALSYKGIGTWHPVQTFQESHEGDVYVHRREGYLADYPEVKIEAEYRFLPDMPFFLFWSRMTVEKPLTVTLLRNNEMT